MIKHVSAVFAFASIVLLASSCNSTFGKRTAYEAYASSLADARLDQTSMGQQWLTAGRNSLERPTPAELPYREKGLFTDNRPTAFGFLVNAKRGQRINFELTTQPASGFRLFIEIWELDGNEKKLVESIDSLSRQWHIDADADKTYILRLQPELLQTISYTLSINTAPSLAFPLRQSDNPRIQSFWGADRDGGKRSHEGIDIFARKGVPVIAAAPGVVTRVNENNLGGKVVFLRPDDSNISLYYAHLDTQLVNAGQRVNVGDPLGTVGNTGNARNTPAHLHFGIYASQGAIDPLPFVNPAIPKLPEIKTDTTQLNRYMRLKKEAVLATDAFAGNEKPNQDLPVIPVAAGADFYRVLLPDGRQAIARQSQITTDPLRKAQQVKTEKSIYARPDSSSAILARLEVGQTMDVIGNTNGYQLVKTAQQTGWVKL